MNKKIMKAVNLLLWLCLWQITAFFVDNRIYFASPYDTLTELLAKAGDVVFWVSILSSLVRIVSGFLFAFLLAYILSFISYRYRWIGEFLSPMVSFLKSVPIAAVVVILLIWWGPDHLVLCISMMVVFPNIYSSMLTGLFNTDSDLLEMSSVFEMKKVDKMLWIYRPSYLPQLHSAMGVSLGLCFKSGVAAEIIGLPEFSIGERLYRDKIYLNTPGVFAWIVAILALSSLTEVLFKYILKVIAKYPKQSLGMEEFLKSGSVKSSFSKKMPDGTGSIPEGYTVFSECVTKIYDGREIVNTSLKLKKGSTYYLDDPSGTGKTTLLKMISGCLAPDSGSVSTGRIAMVFQNDRLIESANVLRNLQVAGCVADPKDHLNDLIPDRIMMLPVSDISGGERRRAAIARALLHPSDIVIMDEPFAGLDENTAGIAAEWIKRHLGDRTLIFTSHGFFPDAFKNSERIKLIWIPEQH